MHWAPVLSFSFLAVIAASDCFANAPLNQTTAQETAKKLNDQGADDSVKGAVTNGMRALNNLNNLNIPGALHNGLKAYGQYVNSEELDKLKEKNQDNSNKMASGANKIGGSNEYASPFARLPKNFLYEGEAGRLAARIEEISGVSREKLLQKVISVERAAKKVPDGQWAQWALNASEDFANSMANEDFREKLLKAHRLAVRTFEAGNLTAVMRKFMGKSEEETKREGASLAVEPVKPTTPASPSPAGDSTAPKAAAPIPAPAEPVPIAASAPEPKAKPPTSSGGIHQLESHGEFMDKLVNTAVNTKERPITIFDMVSGKIRQVNARQRLSH